MIVLLRNTKLLTYVGLFVLMLSFVIIRPVAALDQCATLDQPVDVSECVPPTEESNETVIPAPTFVDATCDAEGYYVIPDDEGVQYIVGKNAEPTGAGTYLANNGELVVINAYANDSFNALTQEGAAQPTSWSHTFAAPNCPQVLGASTTKDDGKVLGEATLADTGFATKLPTLAAIGLITMGAILYRQPRRIRYNLR